MSSSSSNTNNTSNPSAASRDGTGTTRQNNNEQEEEDPRRVAYAGLVRPHSVIDPPPPGEEDPTRTTGTNANAATTTSTQVNYNMSTVSLLTGLYGSRGERIRHVAHTGALQLPQAVLDMLLPSSSEAHGKSTTAAVSTADIATTTPSPGPVIGVPSLGKDGLPQYPLPALDSVRRPSATATRRRMTTTRVTVKTETIPAADSTTTGDEPPRVVTRTHAVNRPILVGGGTTTMTTNSSGSGSPVPADPERIRGGGDGDNEQEKQGEDTVMEDVSRQLPPVQAPPSADNSSNNNNTSTSTTTTPTTAVAALTAPPLPAPAPVTTQPLPSPPSEQQPPVAAVTTTPKPPPLPQQSQPAVSSVATVAQAPPAPQQQQQHPPVDAPPAPSARVVPPTVTAPLPQQQQQQKPPSVPAVVATPSAATVAAPAPPPSSSAVAALAARTSAALQSALQQAQSQVQQQPQQQSAQPTAMVQPPLPPTLPGTIAPTSNSTAAAAAASAAAVAPKKSPPPTANVASATSPPVPAPPAPESLSALPAVATSTDATTGSTAASQPKPAPAPTPDQPQPVIVQGLTDKPTAQWEQHKPGANDEITAAAAPATPPPEWFQADAVSDVERAALPEWFDGSARHRTPATYREARQKAIQMGQGMGNKYVTATLLRRSIPGDAGSLMRLHAFLTAHGLLNGGSASANESAPTPPSLLEKSTANHVVVWTADQDALLVRAVVEHARQQEQLLPPTGVTDAVPPMDWEAIAERVAEGHPLKTATACEQRFLTLPPSAFVSPPSASDTAVTPDGTVASEATATAAHPHAALDEEATAAMPAQVVADLVTGIDPAVLHAVVQAALAATTNVGQAQRAALAALHLVDAARDATTAQSAVAAVAAHLTELRMQQLEHRLAILDDVEGMLEAERVALALERRDLYTARCRHWFGGP